MKRICRILSVVMALLTVFTALPISALADAEKIKINVALLEGESNAFSNFVALRDAFENYGSGFDSTIVLPKNGVYYVDTTGRALIFRSNTTLDLNGSTLIRYGEMLNNNIFQNGDDNGKRDKGGYSLTQNITIKNGTIDGNGGNKTKLVNLMNFGHASNINILNVNIKNLYEGHLIEFSGCKDVTIKNCTFTGLQGDPDEIKEAIQLDISKKGWNGIYLSDSTVCKNVTIESCTFKDYQSGVGNHHTLTAPYHNSNISIIGNTFCNTKSFKQKAPAIWCYGFENSTVKDNVISGVYSEGVMVSGGNVDIIGNKIDMKSVADSSGIYVTQSNSYVYNDDDLAPSTRTAESVNGGNIKNNTVKNYGKNGISINSYSTLGLISENVVNTGKGSGIFVTRSTVTNGINSNTVSNCAYYNNDNLGHGIHITSTSTVKTLNMNVVKSCAGYGIAHFSKLVKFTMLDNKCSSNGSGSIKVSGSGLVANTPANITKVTFTPAETSVKMSWSKVSGVTGYRVYQYNTSTKKWVSVANTTSTAYTFKNLKAGTTYKFTVRAYTSMNGMTVLSPKYSTFTTSTNPATVKFTLTAGSKKATVKWSKVTGATGYIVYYKTSSNGKWTKLTTTKNTVTGYTKTGLTKGKTYYFTVKAYRTTGGKTYNAKYTTKSVKVK